MERKKYGMYRLLFTKSILLYDSIHNFLKRYVKNFYPFISVKNSKPFYEFGFVIHFLV